MRTEAELEKAVKEGAALLDVERAEWAVRIDTGTLDIAEPNDCALGQTYGRYSKGIAALGHASDEDAFDWAVAHGFEADAATNYYDRAMEYRRLTELWVAEVEARRG